MTAIHLNDAELPEAVKHGSHWWLELLDNAETSILVDSMAQINALHSATQKIKGEMRREAKAKANLARQQLGRPEFRADLMGAMQDPAPVLRDLGSVASTNGAVGHAGQPPAELDNISGRAPFAGLHTAPRHICPDCGGDGSPDPSHGHHCRRYDVARLRSHKTTAKARQSLLEFVASDAPEGGWYAAEAAKALAQDVRALLALIENWSGAAR